MLRNLRPVNLSFFRSLSLSLSPPLPLPKMASNMDSLTDGPLVKIGQGFCGTVWGEAAQRSVRQLALKREDGGPGRSVLREYDIHLHLQTLLSRQGRPSDGFRVKCPALGDS